MSEFILEIFSEEIPARMQKAACQALQDHFAQGLADHNLQFEHIKSVVTPRRLALCVQGLPVAQADTETERKGPAVDAPQQAIDGFLASVQLGLDQLEQRDLGKKGVFYFAKLQQKGLPTSEILAQLTTRFLQSYRWPKSMRWGNEEFTWVRPMHSLVALFAGEVLPVPAPHSFVSVGRTSYGHRFMAPEPFVVESWDQYQHALRDRYVVLDPAERTEMIADGYAKVAAEKGLALKESAQAHAAQVAGLVEWPVICTGQFDAAFLEIPAEVLTTSMWSHQFFTPLYTAEDILSNTFVFTANMAPTDGMAEIVAGNEAVLQARLQDAQFFWQTDLEASIEGWNDSLKNQTFHAKLGSVHERLTRFEKLAACIDVSSEPLKLACRYAKADLASEMVGEFPELQGVMGGYYLQAKGFDAAVCTAVSQQYSDQDQTDMVAVQMAVIERLETLSSFFAVGIQPTSSKDPFALRRAALGIIRLAVAHNLKLDFAALAKANYGALDVADKVDYAAYSADLNRFMVDRLRYFLKENYDYDVIESVLGSQWFVEGMDFARAAEACAVLTEDLRKAEGQALLQAFDRINGIFGSGVEGTVLDEALLQKPAEKNLLKQMMTAEIQVLSLMQEGKLAEALAALQPVLQPLENFFEEVLVNDPDLAVASSRRALLHRLRTLMLRFVNFSALVKK
ncbi:MAG: glycine--tRNA ligase subunit beta [Rickettsiales bacterium]|nr:glycine--tRNA ligase subunit beta [Rickettsiales bacterium]|tara:strand:+ start:73246 stop:75288 length:2043 start_codon:yes stop_codon:yes gene_type:complete